MLESRDKTLFERSHQNPIGDPLGGLGRWLCPERDGFKLLRHCPGFQ